MTAYAEHWGRHDVWYQGALRTGRLGVGLVNVDSQLIDYRECKKTAFYNEYLRRNNIDRMMNVCLTTSESDGSYGPVAMSFYRHSGKEPFSSDECGVLFRLTPHLMVAFQNYWAAQSLHLAGRAYQNALDTQVDTHNGREKLLPRRHSGFTGRLSSFIQPIWVMRDCSTLVQSRDRASRSQRVISSRENSCGTPSKPQRASG